MKIFNSIIWVALVLISYPLEAINKKRKPVEFVLLITSFNQEKYARRNLESVVEQRSTLPYQIICVDDGSTDKTGIIMDDFARRYSFIHVIHNTQRVGSALENIYNTVHNHIADGKVVVCVDGDDALSFNGVLERLEKEYEDPDVWMTYGRFVVIPAGEFWSLCWGYPDHVIKERSFRKWGDVVPSHLKTFKAELFKKIKKEDLQYEGKFFRKSWDMAMLYPMLEMCAPKDARSKNHSRFIADTVLYIYNWNPASDGQTNREEQIMLHRYINSLPPYEPVDHL